MSHRLTFLVALVAAAAAGAETPPAPQACDAPSGPSAPVVTEAYRVQAIARPANASPNTPTEYSHEKDAKLRDTIALKVDRLDALLQWQKCTERLGVEKKIVLYIEDRPLPDVVAAPPLDPVTGIVMFPLKRTEASRETWARLLGKPTWNPRTVRVSLGLEDKFGIQSIANLQLKVLPVAWFLFWVAVFAILVAVFGSLAASSDLLRDADAPVIAGKKKPWSLGRVQAAWWFFLVLAAYLFIGLITGDYSSSITATSLVLLGIAAGTTITSAVVDRSRDTPDNDNIENAAKERLAGELKALDTDLASLRNAPADPGKAAELQIKTQERKAKYSQLCKLNRVSECFVTDILSDANGVSLHRFQIAAWTLVLGIVFVVQVFRELAMPKFDDTLLGLMGLSAATFVTLKTTEANAPKPPAPPKP